MSYRSLTNTTLGRFEIGRKLGSGGMAQVYIARQTDLDRTVALKILRPELAHDEATIARFHQEARSAARLEHPHIVPIYEIGELEPPDGPRLHYIAMKYIQGRTLRDLLESEGRLDLPRTVALLAPAGEALQYAHQHGLIHRDIKPSNILITAEQEVYLSDFGLATAADTPGDLTQTGTVIGTPEYMAPEQAEGRGNLGPATDIYALGVVLYEMLSGSLPFEADTPMAMLVARLTRPPRPIASLQDGIPPAMQQILARALERDPAARFGSVAELLAALRSVAATAPAATGAPDDSFQAIPASIGETVALPRPDEPAVPPPPRSTRALPLIAVALVVLLLAVFAGTLLWRQDTPPPPPPVIPVPPTTAPTQPGISPEVRQALEKGWTAFDDSRYNEAVQNFDEASRLDDTAAEPYYGRGRALLEQGRLEEASAQFTAAIRRDPRNAEAHAWQGETYLEQARYELIHPQRPAPNEYYPQAESSFRDAVSLLNQPGGATVRMTDRELRAFALTGLGWALHENGDYQAAERQFRESLEVDNQQAAAHNGLGWTLYTLQDYQAAYSQFYQAIEHEPDYVNAHYGLGRTLEAMDRTGEARRIYEDALEMDPDAPDAEAIRRQLEHLR
jgi:serine/threonine-protein kinase